MIKRCLLIFVSLGTTACQYSLEQQPADIVFKNGVIYSVDQSNPQTEAMAITEAYIAYVESLQSLDKMISASKALIRNHNTNNNYKNLH